MAFSLNAIKHFIERHILAFGLGVAIVVLLIGGYFFVLPRVQQVQALGGLDYQQKQRLYAVQEQYLADLRALGDEVNAVSPEDIDRLEAIIPRGKDIPGIFLQMQAFANEANMPLQSVSVSDGATVGGTGASSGLRTVTVSVIMSGALDYDRLKNFLNVVSRQAPLLDLTAISHSPAALSGPTSYSFSFRSYYFEG